MSSTDHPGVTPATAGPEQGRLRGRTSCAHLGSVAVLAAFGPSVVMLFVLLLARDGVWIPHDSGKMLGTAAAVWFFGPHPLALTAQATTSLRACARTGATPKDRLRAMAAAHLAGPLAVVHAATVLGAGVCYLLATSVA